MHLGAFILLINILICTNNIIVGKSTCGIPPNPYNGFSEVIDGIPGEVCSVVEFSCQNGANLVGNPIVTCQPNGQFDAPLPTCTGTLYIFLRVLATEY